MAYIQPYIQKPGTVDFSPRKLVAGAFRLGEERAVLFLWVMSKCSILETHIYEQILNYKLSNPNYSKQVFVILVLSYKVHFNKNRHRMYYNS